MDNGRNLILCFDGTNNEFGPENTNVIRLIQLLDRDSSKQRLYYDPGVGTLPEPGISGKLRSAWSKVKGLGFGAGLIWKVQEAYSYLMDCWEPGDRVYLFGFSRGAYTARVLAGLLHALGLVPQGNYNLIPYALRYFQQMRNNGKTNAAESASTEWKEFCDAFRRTFCRQIRPGDDQRHFGIYFLGVWDTVSSVGWVWDPKHFPYTAYNPSVSHIRHAVSIDERRAFFRQNLFHAGTDQDVFELWFPGVHSDVGGGYSDSRLWWSPFVWMLEEATQAGLLIDQFRKNEVLANPPSQPWAELAHNSLTWKWYVGEIWPKVRYKQFLPWPNFARPRQIHSGALVDRSALDRLRDPNLGYVSKALPSDFCASVRGLSSVPSFLPIP